MSSLHLQCHIPLYVMNSLCQLTLGCNLGAVNFLDWGLNHVCFLYMYQLFIVFITIGMALTNHLQFCMQSMDHTECKF